MNEDPYTCPIAIVEVELEQFLFEGLRRGGTGGRVGHRKRNPKKFKNKLNNGFTRQIW